MMHGKTALKFIILSFWLAILQISCKYLLVKVGSVTTWLSVTHIVNEYAIYRHQAINSIEHTEYELLNPITLAEQLSTSRETVNSAMKRLCKIVYCRSVCA